MAGVGWSWQEIARVVSSWQELAGPGSSWQELVGVCGWMGGGRVECK